MKLQRHGGLIRRGLVFLNFRSKWY